MSSERKRESNVISTPAIEEPFTGPGIEIKGGRKLSPNEARAWGRASRDECIHCGASIYPPGHPSTKCPMRRPYPET